MTQKASATYILTHMTIEKCALKPFWELTYPPSAAKINPHNAD